MFSSVSLRLMLLIFYMYSDLSFGRMDRHICTTSILARVTPG